MRRTMTNTGARLGQRRRRAGTTPARRAAQDPRKRDNVMTKIDCLIEVAKKLKEARTLGEGCSDRALLYFIDMTIGHVCDSLSPPRQSEDAGEEAHLSVALASL
jgi:hypothetical protein